MPSTPGHRVDASVDRPTLLPRAPRPAAAQPAAAQFASPQGAAA